MYDSLFLSDVEQGTEFHLVTGQTIKNIYELVGALKSLSPENFSHHCNSEKDDFGAWITHSLHNNMAGNILSRVKEQKKYIRIIEKAINHKEIESQARLHVVKVSRLWLDNNKKALSEMHHHIKDYERKISEKHKEIDELINKSVDKYVESFLSKHKSEMKRDIENTLSMIKGLEGVYEEELKSKEAQLEKSIDEQMKKSAEKYAEEVIKRHKQEFVDIIWNEKTEAKKEVQSTVQKELIGITDKQREMIQLELDKTLEKQKELEKALEENLKNKEQELISKITEHSQKELSEKVSKQRELLDTELSKTIKSNRYFLEKFENEIKDKEKRLTETINSAVEKELMKSIIKHQKELDTSLAKALESLKITQKECDSKLLDRHPELINEASQKIRDNVIRYFAEQRELIEKEIKKQLDVHAQNAALQHKELLNKELNSAVINTKQITKDVEDRLHGKTQEIAVLAEELVSKALDKKLDKTLDKHKSNITAESDKVIDFIIQKQKEHEEHLSLKEEELKKIVEDAVIEAIDENVKALIEEHQQNLDEKLEEHEKSLDEELEKVSSLHKDLENKYYKAVEEKGEKIADKVSKKTDAQLQILINKKTTLLERELMKIKSLMDSIAKQKSELLNEKSKILADIKQAADSRISAKMLEIEKKTAKYKLEVDALERDAAGYKEKIKQIEDRSRENNKKIILLEQKLDGLGAKKTAIADKKIEKKAMKVKEPKSKPTNNVVLKTNKPKESKYNGTDGEKKIYKLIDECEYLLMNGRYEDVKRAYHEIVELYKKGEYDSADRIDLYEAIKAVYDDIWQYAEKKKSNVVQFSKNN